MCESERLQKLQNMAARSITFSDLNVRSSGALLGDLGWNSLEQRRSKQLAIILFKFSISRFCSLEQFAFEC